MINIIAAIGRNRVLGKDNQLLWHIPDDLKRFKQLTLGHPVIMGRKTFESIVRMLGRPLPGRTNIILTRYKGLDDLMSAIPESRRDFHIVNSIEEAIERAQRAPGGEDVFIVGGGEIYRQALPRVDKLYLTLIEDEKEGDSYFPAYENDFTKKTFEEERESEDLKYSWVDLER